MNNKKQIRLTESDLKQIVKESVNKILSEAYGTVPRSDEANWEAADGNYLVPEGGADADYKRIGDIKRLLGKCLDFIDDAERGYDNEDRMVMRYYTLLRKYIEDYCFKTLDRMSAIKSMKMGMTGEHALSYDQTYRPKNVKDW